MSLQYAWSGQAYLVRLEIESELVEGHISIIATESNAERAKSIDMAIPIPISRTEQQQNQPRM